MFRGSVSRTVVDNDQFELANRLSEHGIDRFEQHRAPIESRDDDGDLGRHGASARLAAAEWGTASMRRRRSSRPSPEVVEQKIGGTRIESYAPEVTDRDTWPEPDMRLVEDDRLPAPALDDDALPAGWSAWISAEAAARGCPRDYVAAGLNAGASVWIGNARHVGATATILVYTLADKKGG